MLRSEMDRIVDEHFGFEAADDVDGVLATMVDDATHHLIGSPLGEIAGKPAIRDFYLELFGAVAGQAVKSIRRRYGDRLLIDESRWTGAVHDGRLFGFPGRSGQVIFRLLHITSSTTD